MSTTAPETRSELKEYCLRRLGKPVIQINVADSQVEDLITEAIDFFQMNHFDGYMDVYLPLQITADVKSKGWVGVDDSIFGITNLLETTFNAGQFTVDYQLMANAVPFSLVGNGLLTYSMSLTYREDFKFITTGKTKMIRYNRHTKRLYIDANLSQVPENTIYMAVCQRRADPEEYPEIYNDPFLKNYLTALIKRQWGNNLRKLVGVQLVGGVTLDGAAILAEAEEEIQKMKDAILTEFQEPCDFYCG